MKNKVKVICSNCKKEIGYGVLTVNSDETFAVVNRIVKYDKFDYFDLRIACCEECVKAIMNDGEVEI